LRDFDDFITGLAERMSGPLDALAVVWPAEEPEAEAVWENSSEALPWGYVYVFKR
jgi:hypothetical protein